MVKTIVGYLVLGLLFLLGGFTVAVVIVVLDKIDETNTAQAVAAALISPDGQYQAVKVDVPYSTDPEYEIVEVATGKEVFRISKMMGYFTSAGFCDNHKFVTVTMYYTGNNATSFAMASAMNVPTGETLYSKKSGNQNINDYHWACTP